MSDEYYDDVERQRVWVSLSDLFLDTEITAADCENIAKELAVTSFSTDELVHIYEDEVAPVLVGNLRIVAGVWGAFDAEEVIKIVRKRLVGLKGKKSIKGIPPIAAVRRWYNLGPSEAEWKQVLGQLIRLRGETDRA